MFVNGLKLKKSCIIHKNKPLAIVLIFFNFQVELLVSMSIEREFIFTTVVKKKFNSSFYKTLQYL